MTPPDLQAITPTWSADGKWIAYRTSAALMKTAVGASTPAVKIAASGGVPSLWSPDGKWITATVDGGIGVISPDGEQKQVLFRRLFDRWSAVGWSRDGGTLYLTEGGGDLPTRLSAADLAKDTERLIHEYPPDGSTYAELYVSSARLSISRDGRSLLGPRWSVRSSIWLLEGVTPPRSWWERLLR